jgi:pimeloyl-ACP methyl ester carboxylesterase
MSETFNANGNGTAWARKATALLAAATLVTGGLSACDDDDDEGGPAKPAPAASTPAQPVAPISWGACPALAAGAQRDPRQTCGTLKVPLDYKNPGGETIDIAVSKLTTAKSGEKRGALVVNPGGPALPGLDTPSAMAATVPASVLAKYDLIGFDPRGVARSTPQSCGLGNLPNVALFPFPAADGSITKNVEFAKATAQKCSSNAKLKYFTTVNTARDMDKIRQGLGVEKIAYWGQSYGTYLGEAYDSLFPGQVDKMVLEGNVDPAKAWKGEVAGWGKGMTERFPDVAAVAAQQTGKSAEQVTQEYLALVDRLDRKPVQVPGTPATLDGALVRNYTYALLLHNETLPMLPALWKAAADIADNKITDADKEVLKQVFADQPAPGDVPGDNAAAIFLALSCGDVAWPSGTDGVQAAVTADRKQYPLTAGMPANVWACAFWPGQPIDKPVKVTDQGARNIMILQNRRDNATPWDSGVGLKNELGKRAAFVGVDNGGHYVYNAGSSCADQATVAFLAEDKLPGADLNCTDVKKK